MKKIVSMILSKLFPPRDIIVNESFGPHRFDEEVLAGWICSAVLTVTLWAMVSWVVRWVVS